MKQYYLTSPSGIANYLCRTIASFGYFVQYYRSDASESIYLNIYLGTRESPDALRLRISNHSVSRYNAHIHFDYDICGSRSRQGATTYIKFLIKFANEHNKALSSAIQALQPGTPKYKQYAISMQKRAAV